MNIVLSADNGYIDHCLSTISSILENNQNVSLYILTEGFSFGNQKRLDAIASKYGAQINIINISLDLLSNLPMPKDTRLSHISVATYYRLFITELLPKHVHKVIYLDCDIIVRKSLMHLWETDMSNYCIGAVYQIETDSIVNATRLGYPIQYGYFNAGVLLINVSKWRELGAVHLFTEYLKDNFDNIVFHDQDVLNAVFYNRCLKLSCKYNMMPIYFTKGIYANAVLKNNGVAVCSYEDYIITIQEEIKDPTIIHFAAKIKPWDKKCTHPLKSEYYRYAKKCDSFHSLGFVDFIFTKIHFIYRKMGFSDYAL